MKTFRVCILLTVLVLSLAACSRAATPQPVSMTIQLSEYKFDPSSLEFKVGQQVTLELVNDGQLQHEVMFGRDVKKENNRPAGYQVDMFDAGGVKPEVNITEEGKMTGDVTIGEQAGFMVILGAGGRGTMTFNVTEGMVGEWEIGCFEQQGVHYDAGMHGPVTVSR